MIDMLKIYNTAHTLKNNVAVSFNLAIGFIHIRLYLVFILLFNALSWFLGRKIKVGTGDEQIALHYTIDFGVDYYGDSGKIFIIPILGLLIALLNAILCLVLAQKRDFRIFSHFLLAVALLCNLVLLAAATSVYLINFR